MSKTTPQKSNLKSNFFKTFHQIIVTISLFSLLGNIFFLKIEAFSQSTQNAIDLQITRVTKDGKTMDTRASGTNNWIFDGGTLNDLDNIRYAWKQAILDTKNEKVPILAGGFLKIYLGDASKEENLLVKHGESPLPINLFASRLTAGDNKLLFVYIDHTNKPQGANTKVAFNFKYNPTSDKPKINIIEPAESAVFRANSARSFSVQLDNFNLSESSANNPSVGQLKVYYNSVKEENFLGTVKSSKEIGPTSHLAEFTTETLNQEKLIKISIKKK